MNLKERGITVGDLLILIVIILTTTILFKNFDKNKNKTLNPISGESYLLSRNYLKN